MKHIIIHFLLVALLAGCSIEKVKYDDNLIEATVTDKSTESFGRGTGYYITVEKNGQSIRLRVDSDRFGMIEKGVVLSGYYDSDGVLNNISFPKLSEKPIDKDKE